MKTSQHNSPSRHRTPLLLALLAFAAVLSRPLLAAAQTVEAPSYRELFTASRKSTIRQKKKVVRKILAVDPAATTTDFDVNSPQGEFDKETNTLTSKGGVVLSYGGARVQADEAKVNTQTKESEIRGRVVMSHPTGNLTAEEAKLNFETENGEFNCARLTIEEEGFKIGGEKIEKLSEDRYAIKNAKLSSCHCPPGATDSSEEGDKNAECSSIGANPWSINADTVRITRDGYAHAYGNWIEIGDVPVIYSPYLGFPIKEERQSGLLAPRIGYNDQNGFITQIPFFGVIDENSDVLIDPFLQTKTRVGTGFQYRRAFSTRHTLDTGMIYSDESERGDNLRGTNINGMFDPEIDSSRIGLYYNHLWRSAPGTDYPLTFIANGKYVSDDLVIRELEMPKIGDPTDRFVTSSAVLRTGLSEYGEAQILTEYDQSVFDENDDTLLQKLPELRVDLQRSLRPFGYNPYGLKVVPQLKYQADQFVRSEGYDGVRSSASPSVAVPFHISNYVQGAASMTFLRNDYWLDETEVLNQNRNLDDRSTRSVPIFNYTTSTGIERVFSLDPDSWLTTLTSLGAANQENRLTRVKHTIDPFFRFTNIPLRDSDSNTSTKPIFGPLDQIGSRRLYTYGFKSSLYGRFLPTNRAGETIPEVVPEVTDLPIALDGDNDMFGAGGGAPSRGNFSLRKGEMRELVRFNMQQSWDQLEASKDLDPNRDAFTAIGTNLYLFPSQSFATGIETNYSKEESLFDSVMLSTHFFDDRTDALRARWTFTRDTETNERSVSQIELGGEIKLTDLVRIAGYTRYDQLTTRSLRSEGVIRFSSSCNCWSVDVGYGQQVNPDQRQLGVTFTFTGLGDISHNIRVDQGTGQ